MVEPWCTPRPAAGVLARCPMGERQSAARPARTVNPSSIKPDLFSAQQPPDTSLPSASEPTPPLLTRALVELSGGLGFFGPSVVRERLGKGLLRANNSKW